MRARALASFALVACIAVLPGCRFGRAAVRAGGSFFSSPRAVAKADQPIKKDARLAIIWVGHATVLVQIDDKVILTDPVFTSTVGQHSKRLVEPGIDPDKLPPVDAVLVSHMHFDHLSLGSLSMIEDKVRMLLLPRGGTTYLTDFSFPSVELAPWQPWEKDGLRVTAAPVNHVGFRYGVDDAWMKDSFTGYVVEYHGIKVYFGGDTAYDQRLFVETAHRFPKLDLALLPIGPIEPRDFMRRFHMDPHEAVQAFVDLDAQRMVPIHYDTFINSTDNPGDCLRELGEARKRYSLGEREVIPVGIGEQWVFLKQGEEPKHTPLPVPKPPPAPSAAPPTPPPAEKEPPKEIPEEDRLD